MADTEYNGWPNYQTWNVMLWMDNEEGPYRMYREKVQRYRDRKPRARPFGAAAARAVCEAAFGDQTGDGVHFSNSRIRWGKIAEAMRAE
jgi:hypothetical protein